MWYVNYISIKNGKLKKIKKKIWCVYLSFIYNHIIGENSLSVEANAFETSPSWELKKKKQHVSGTLPQFHCKPSLTK